MTDKKILLIDDDKDFVAAQTVLIGHSGYKTVKAYSASEGYKIASEEKPDLIVLDVNMETRNAGFELNSQIRNDASLKHIPIIMLTGIETYSINQQALDMYNEMMASGNVDLKEVLKVSGNSEVSVQFRDDDGKVNYLALDSFVSKTQADTMLVPEIKRLIG